MNDTNPLPNNPFRMPPALLVAALPASECNFEQRATQKPSDVPLNQNSMPRNWAVCWTKRRLPFEELNQAHAATLDELAWYKRWAFGRRRERFTEGKGQGHLFELDLSLTDNLEETTTLHQEVETEVKSHRRRRKRQIDWDKLRIKSTTSTTWTMQKRSCPCCGKPMHLHRRGHHAGVGVRAGQAGSSHIHVRPKYACRRCKDGVYTAPVPRRPIPGGIAGPGLITEVYVGKFGDHLPLYRLEDILARYGVYISRSTLCDWMKAVANLFRPLYELQRERVLQSAVMWTDDTRITVLGGEEGSFKGYFWTYIEIWQHPYSVYDFTPNRSRDGPASFLESGLSLRSIARQLRRAPSTISREVRRNGGRRIYRAARRRPGGPGSGPGVRSPASWRTGRCFATQYR